ncbi:hypothetical protein N9Z25_06695 [Luminiphilus sp.]|nr:hypothetical protein [Luminiphilus sp.]
MLRQIYKIIKHTIAANKADVLVISAGKSGSTYLTQCITKRSVYHVHSIISDFYFKYQTHTAYQKLRYQVLLIFAKSVWAIVRKWKAPQIIVFPYRENDQHRISLFFNDLEDFIYLFKKNHKETYRTARYEGALEFLSLVKSVMVAENPTRRLFLEWQYLLGAKEIVLPDNRSTIVKLAVNRSIIFLVPSALLSDFVSDNVNIFDNPIAERINQSEEFWWASLYYAVKNAEC